MLTPIWERRYDRILVQVYNRADLGKAGALCGASKVKDILDRKGEANLLFSTGASQFDLVAGLGEQKIPWEKVRAFHLDEYRGIAADHPASFRLWLRTRVEQPFAPKEFYFLEGDAPDSAAECARYTKLILGNPMDLGFIGIGENGHIAFNDPPVADFGDPETVKVVQLDEGCRRQQLGEGWFPTMDAVPQEALTLTVPAIMRTAQIISFVPDARKAQAVRNALLGPIHTACPASILRTHPATTLLLDEESASLL